MAIVKYLQGGAQQDNTRVSRPIIMLEKIIPKGYVREKNNNPVSFDTEGNLVDLITNEKGTMMLPEITVRGISPEIKYRNYSSAYHPEDALEFLDIMTRPLTRPFSASLLIGAIRNKVNGGTYWGSLLGNEENLGIVSKNFNKEHPYLSTAANIGIDILTPSAVGGTKSLATRLFPKSIIVYKGGAKPFTQDYTFFTTDKEYAKLFGPVLKYKLKYRHPAYTEEPITYKNMEGIHFYIDDNLRLLNKPLSDIIIGHDALTNEGLIPSKGTEYVVWNPKQIKVMSKNKTALGNNMYQFFSGIKDWNKAANYLSKYSLRNGGKL